MTFREILKGRKCGYFRINSCWVYKAPLEKIMKSFGLFPNPEALREIDVKSAKEVLVSVLWKDLAYKTELISKELAEERAGFLIEQFQDSSTKMYTNGDWVNYHEKKSSGWSPLTSSTFDAGVIFVDRKHAACVWVEDND